MDRLIVGRNSPEAILVVSGWARGPLFYDAGARKSPRIANEGSRGGMPSARF
ncbi:hypothetical protein IF1G_06811 [Cordyceps javanica]|uniref:Uncharacterized protein n=1 Tax=Cordyceps javanica TaxID=43265 RepID=A0A545UZA5_9HYPO|nr:hypothetical protein IF1G_06811 [Cordyceps javanica]